MKKIRKYLALASIFIAGLIIGVVAMGYSSVYSSKTFVDLFRMYYLTEQTKLAAKAHTDGNKYAEFVYRYNIVSASPLGKLKTFNTMKSGWTLGFPLAVPWLHHILSASGEIKGRKLIYGLEVGRLAEATENIGLRERAAKLWKQSSQLTGINDMGRLRSIVADLHKSDEISSTSQTK